MLDRMRSYSKSFLIWLLFGVLIAVFVIGFGTPGSDKMSCGEATRIGEVAGHDLSREDFKYAFRLTMREQAPATMKAFVLDMLLRREILANEARELGFRPAVRASDAAEDPDVAEMLADRKAMVLGYERDLFAIGGWPSVRQTTGKHAPAKNFNYEHFKKWVMWHVGLSVPAFMRQQQRELMAKQMAEVIKSGVQVSESEARALYEQQNHAATVEISRFDVEDYKEGVVATPQEVEKLLADDKAVEEVKGIYEARYKGQTFDPQRRIRHIFIEVAKDAKQAERQSAKAELRRLGRKLTAETFAQAAEERARDETDRFGGGLLGWKSAEDLKNEVAGLGESFAKQVFELEMKKISDPIASEKGWHLVLVEGARKGSWPLEKAKPFLAEKMVVRNKAVRRARQAAKKRLSSLKKGDTSAKSILPRKEARGGEADASEAKANVETPKTGGSDAIQVTAEPPPFEIKTVDVPRVAERVEGLEEVPNLVSRVWALTEKEPVLDEVLKIEQGGRVTGFGVVRMKEIHEPDWKAFESQKDVLMERYLQLKQVDTLNRWVRTRCEELVKEGKIWIDAAYTKIRYYPEGQRGPDAKPVTIKYKYCQQLPHHARAAMQRPSLPPMQAPIGR